MEFLFLGRALKAFVEINDRLFQKSLKRAIPDLDQLLDDPHKTLGCRQIIIGPSRKYFSRVLVGLLVAYVGFFVFAVLFLMLDRVLGLAWISKESRLIACIFSTFITFVLVFRSFRGGYCILKQEAVEFIYRNRVVRCSWTVFNTWGQPVYLEDTNQLLLPISPHATDLIEEMNIEEGAARSKGLEVRTHQWETRTPTEAILKPLFVVGLEKLGGLLLQLGQKLGVHQSLSENRTSPAKGACPANPLLAPELLTFPIATRENSGWIRMSLARFIFPPFCCICTVPTLETHVFPCPNQGGKFQIQLPTCKKCGKRFRRRKLNLAFFLTLISLIGLYFFFVLGFNPFQGQNLLAGVLAGSAGIVGVSWAIVSLVFHYFGQPVKVRFTSNKGTFRIRFRNAEYEEMILAMRVQVQT
jgi:hypothetical protein